MQAPKKAFRSSVGGYNKQDVNDYISQLVGDYERDRKQLAEQIAELEKQKKELTEKSSGTESAEKLSAELATANTLISHQNESLESMKLELESLKAQLGAKCAELAETGRRLDAYSESEDKLKDYERMSSKLGALLIEAASNADRIKSEAQTSAERTLSDAKERERELSERYNRLSDELEAKYRAACDTVDRRLAEYAENGISSLKEALGECASALCDELDAQKLKIRSSAIRKLELPPELLELSVSAKKAPDGAESEGTV